MRRVLLFVGIAVFVLCVLSLLFAALNLFGYHNVLDGSAELYGRLHQRAILFFVIGIILAVAATVCMIVSLKGMKP